LGQAAPMILGLLGHSIFGGLRTMLHNQTSLMDYNFQRFLQRI
jgi:hypothetical protein